MQAGLNNALSATFLAVVVACLGRIFVRRPAVLHCLWFLVLLKLVSPPLYQVSVPYPDPFRAIAEATRSRIAGRLDLAEVPVPGVPPVEGSVELTQASIEAMVVELSHDASDIGSDSDGMALALADLSQWLRTDGIRLVETTWLVGTVMTLLISCWRIRQFQHLLKAAQPATEGIQDWVDELSADLGLSRAPSVWWISGKLSPMLWALGRSPRLIIPIELWKSLDNRQRGTLLVHELAHLRRGDHHVRMFELVVTALYWWNPVLWWVRRALRDVEEQCCDAWVVWAFPDAAKSYAETLLETLDFLQQSDRVEPLLASGFGKVHHLRKRLTMIMNGNTPRSVSFWGALGSLSLAVVLLPFNASWAQKADEPKEVQVIVKSVDEPDKATEGTGTIESGTHRIVREVISTFPEDQVLTEDVRLEKISPEPVVVRFLRQGLNKNGDDKHVVHLELKIDGSGFAIEADSIREAIDKLNDQIKILSKKSPQSTKDKQRAEALTTAVKALANTTKKMDEANAKAKDAKGKIEKKVYLLEQFEGKLQDEKKALEGKLQDEKKAVLRKIEQGKKISAENAARLTEKLASDLDGIRQVRVRVNASENENASDDKKAADRTAIRKQVEKLSAELREKRVELAAAQKRLSALEHEANIKAPRSVTITKPLTKSPVIGEGKPDDPTEHRVELHIRSFDESVKDPGRTLSTKLPSSDQMRIDALERTLKKLLAEVASLKKEKGGAQ